MKYTEEMMQKALDHYITNLDLTNADIFFFDVNSPLKMKIHIINNLQEMCEKETKENVRQYFGLSGYIYRMYLLSKNATDDQKLDFILDSKEELYDYAINHLDIQKILEKDDEAFAKINVPDE